MSYFGAFLSIHTRRYCSVKLLSCDNNTAFLSILFFKSFLSPRKFLITDIISVTIYLLFPIISDNNPYCTITTIPMSLKFLPLTCSVEGVPKSVQYKGQQSQYSPSKQTLSLSVCVWMSTLLIRVELGLVVWCHFELRHFIDVLSWVGEFMGLKCQEHRKNLHRNPRLPSRVSGCMWPTDGLVWKSMQARHSRLWSEYKLLCIKAGISSTRSWHLNSSLN